MNRTYEIVVAFGLAFCELAFQFAVTAFALRFASFPTATGDTRIACFVMVGVMSWYFAGLVFAAFLRSSRADTPDWVRKEMAE